MLADMIAPLRRYAQFRGRARRREYWLFLLFCALVNSVLVACAFVLRIDPAPGLDAAERFTRASYVFLSLAGLFGLATLVPGIAVAVRRLHDRNLSGWWLLAFAVAMVIPHVGSLARLAFMVVTALPGVAGANRFGKDPRGPETSTADVFY